MSLQKNKKNSTMVVVRGADVVEVEAKTPTKSRGWCGTWPNPPNEDMKQCLTEILHEATYWVSGKEVCPTTGTPHWQMYWYFENPRSFAGVKKLFAHKGAPHIESQKANNNKKAIDYCKKDGKWVENGKMPSQGHRTDIDALVVAIQSGKTMAELAEELPHMVLKMHSGIQALMSWRLEPYAGERTVVWCSGPSGAGKSYWARNYLKECMTRDGIVTKEDQDAQYYEKTDTTKWFQNYTGQQYVLFDDWRQDETQRNSNAIPFNVFLGLIGSDTKTRVEIKGGSFPWRAKVIVITTIQHYNDCVPLGEPAAQLERRITEHRVFKHVQEYHQEVHRKPITTEMEAYDWSANHSNEPQPQLLASQQELPPLPRAPEVDIHGLYTVPEYEISDDDEEEQPPPQKRQRRHAGWGENGEWEESEDEN